MSKQKDYSGWIIGAIVLLNICYFFDVIVGDFLIPQPEPTITSSQSESTTTSDENYPSSESSDEQEVSSARITDYYLIVDPKWPTSNPELKDIPESGRWYDTRDAVGSYASIAGPIVRIYQDTDSYGMPIFVELGNPYPDLNRFVIVIWDNTYYGWSEMLSSVTPGESWIQVEGYISSYEGVPELNTGDGWGLIPGRNKATNKMFWILTRYI